jgi:hypothetical protein
MGRAKTIDRDMRVGCGNLEKMDGRRKMNRERIAELIFILESQQKM